MNNFNPYGYQMQQPRSNNINWVQGLEGAKAFQIPPGSNILLMDSENEDIFYIKVSDNVGMCTMRTFKYKEITDQDRKTDISKYVTKDELMNILNERGRNNGKQFVQPNKQSER